MSLKKILTQKLRDPINTDNWIEINYIGKEEGIENAPVLFTHGKLADDRVIESKNIDDGAVTRDKIADEAIDNSKIADEAITTDKIVDLNVGDTKIANGAIKTVKIDKRAVTTEKINNKAVTWAKIDWTQMFKIEKIEGEENKYKLNIGTGAKPEPDATN